MDSAVVANAVGSLEVLLSQAKRGVRGVEVDVVGHPGYGDFGGYVYPREAMKASLEELHDVLLVVLEAANMPQTRASLIDAWRGFTEDKGLTYTRDNEEFQ